MKFTYRPSKGFVISILIILFIVFLSFVLDLYFYERQSSRRIEQEGKLVTKELTLNVETFLREIEGVADRAAEQISSGSKDDIVSELDRILKFEHAISNIGVLFVPHSYDESLRLYSPYILKEGNDTEILSFDSYYDYTTAAVPWFGESIKLEKSWTKPFYDEISREEFVYFTRRFTMGGGKNAEPSGILFIGVPLKDLKNKLSSLNLEHPGQPYIVTVDGLEITQSPHSRGGVQAIGPGADNADNREPGLLKVSDPNTGETIYRFVSPLESSDWIVVFEIVENEFLENYSLYRKILIGIVVSLAALVTALALYNLKPLTSNYRSGYLFWFFMALFFLYMLVSIYICWIGLEYQDKSEKELNAIINKSLLEDFKLKYIKYSLEQREDPPVFIPTGIFVESITSQSSNRVNAKGIIWQKYYKGVHDDIARGISIPNAVDVNLSKFLKKTYDDYTLVEWTFNLNITSDFNYSRYPFGNENMWLQIKQQEFDKNIVLVPDLDSYRVSSTRYLPGLDKNIQIRDWEIQNSFFSYTFNSYNTNFGIENFIGQYSFPEIYFNIIIRPNILNVFISHFLPIGIAIFLIFAIFKTATGHYVVRPYATLFLALIFLQISLRSNLGANEIVYIEYYYFLTYFIMAGVSLNAVLVQNSSWELVHYKNNLIPKLFFWPFTGLAILILNTLVFYD
jgi:hypothetical protein